MPKHIIEFNLPDEQAELTTTLEAGRMASLLWLLEQDVLHSYTKYGIPEEFISSVIQHYGKEKAVDYNLVLATIEALKTRYYILKNDYEILE